MLHSLVTHHYSPSIVAMSERWSRKHPQRSHYQWLSRPEAAWFSDRDSEPATDDTATRQHLDFARIWPILPALAMKAQRARGRGGKAG
jgi:hypothetical protein